MRPQRLDVAYPRLGIAPALVMRKSRQQSPTAPQQGTRCTSRTRARCWTTTVSALWNHLGHKDHNIQATWKELRKPRAPACAPQRSIRIPHENTTI